MNFVAKQKDLLYKHLWGRIRQSQRGLLTRMIIGTLPCIVSDKVKLFTCGFVKLRTTMLYVTSFWICIRTQTGHDRGQWPQYFTLLYLWLLANLGLASLLLYPTLYISTTSQLLTYHENKHCRNHSQKLLINSFLVNFSSTNLTRDYF